MDLKQLLTKLYLNEVNKLVIKHSVTLFNEYIINNRLLIRKLNNGGEINEWDDFKIMLNGCLTQLPLILSVLPNKTFTGFDFNFRISDPLTKDQETDNRLDITAHVKVASKQYDFNNLYLVAEGINELEVLSAEETTALRNNINDALNDIPVPDEDKAYINHTIDINLKEFEQLDYYLSCKNLRVHPFETFELPNNLICKRT